MTPPVIPPLIPPPCPHAERRAQLGHLALVCIILLLVGVGLWLLAQHDLLGGKIFLLLATALAIPTRIGKAWEAVRGVLGTVIAAPAPAAPAHPDPATPAPTAAPSAPSAEDVG